MRDSLGRDLNYLRVSLTDRCNLRCIYCMPPEGIEQLSHVDVLRNEEFLDVIRVAADLGFSHIRLTGGEPLVRKGIVELVRNIKALPGIDNVSLTTNGILLPKLAEPLREAGLDRINLSLDTLDADQYRFITRCGSLDACLAGLEAALQAGFEPIKINAVAVRRLNQDFFAFARMSVDRPLHMRFIEYMPVGHSGGVDGSGWGPEDVITCEEIRQCINAAAREAGVPELEPLPKEKQPLGFGPAAYWKFPGAKGTVGFISPLSNHFCSSCNRLRLTADGKLRPCLFSDREYDVRDAVRAGSDAGIREAFFQAVGNKPAEHHDEQGTDRRMSQIGG